MIDELPSPEDKQQTESPNLIKTNPIDDYESLNDTLSDLIEKEVQVYTVALADGTEVPLQNAIETAFRTDLVHTSQEIVNKLQGYSSIITEPTPRLIRATEEKIPVFIYDPRHREVKFQFTFERGKDFEITLEDPDGNYVYPYAQEDAYQLYWVSRPMLGWWQITIRNPQGSSVRQTAAVRKEPRADVIQFSIQTT